MMRRWKRHLEVIVISYNFRLAYGIGGLQACVQVLTSLPVSGELAPVRTSLADLASGREIRLAYQFNATG